MHVISFSDGSSQQLGGCLRDFRNKPFPVRVKIEYYKKALTVQNFYFTLNYFRYNLSSNSLTFVHSFILLLDLLFNL